MIRALTALGFAACAAASSASAGEGPSEATGPAKPRELPREEVTALFARLEAAAREARSFQADLRRTEESAFLLDAEPLVQEGRVAITRNPDRFRTEIVRPRPSLTIVSETDIWQYLEGEREAQHVDRRKGLEGKAEATSGWLLALLAFDLEVIEKTYRVSVRTCEPPEGVTIRKVERPGPDEGGEGAGEEKPEKGGEAEAVRPEECFRIEFVPKRPELAPGLLGLTLLVDGRNPWPLKIVRETADEDVITSEFANIVLDAELPRETFEFRPPRGTKVVELGGR
jgi:outer membrane lipoprotein-sorting protein